MGAEPVIEAPLPSPCLRPRPSGRLASLRDAVRFQWPLAGGWTGRLRALAPGHDRPLIDCLSTASRTIAVSGSLAIGAGALLAGDVPSVPWAIGYAGYGIAAMAVAERWRRRQESATGVVLVADLIAGALCAGLPGGLEMVALPAFVCALLAAALRWGTAMLPAGMAAAAIGWISGGATDIDRGIVGPLLLIAPAIAWSGAAERRRRAEAAAADRLVSHARSDRGFSPSLQAVLEDLLRLFGAREAPIVTRDETPGRALIGELTGASGLGRTLQWREISDGSAAAAATLTERASGRRHVRIPFQGEDWTGSLLIVDPAPGHDSARAARFLARAAHELI